MTVHPNGTDAKDIALHFVKMTTERATPQIMAKTVKQAKSLLASGYTKEEIIEVIDFLIRNKGVQMYSLGYVSACINDVLREIQVQKTCQEVKEQLASVAVKQRSEVVDNGESTQRNRDKVGRFGIQSRFGKKFDFDLFERH